MWMMWKTQNVGKKQSLLNWPVSKKFVWLKIVKMPFREKEKKERERECILETMMSLASLFYCTCNKSNFISLKLLIKDKW